MKGVEDALRGIEEEIENGFIEVKLQDFKTHPKTKHCTASTLHLKFEIFEFDIEDQGFPPGSMGYDGAVTSKDLGGIGGALIVHLPRALAEKAFKAAEKAAEEKKQ